MDVFELCEEERYGDEYPWKNPKGRKSATKRAVRVKREIIKEAIGKPKIMEKSLTKNISGGLNGSL